MTADKCMTFWIPKLVLLLRCPLQLRFYCVYMHNYYIVFPPYSNGYKMCIRAYLNGDGIGYKTHFSVFFVLMKGEFDPLLKWPFEYKVS